MRGRSDHHILTGLGFEALDEDDWLTYIYFPDQPDTVWEDGEEYLVDPQTGERMPVGDWSEPDPVVYLVHIVDAEKPGKYGIPQDTTIWGARYVLYRDGRFAEIYDDPGDVLGVIQDESGYSPETMADMGDHWARKGLGAALVERRDPRVKPAVDAGIVLKPWDPEA
jgi:hypothetical protein